MTLAGFLRALALAAGMAAASQAAVQATTGVFEYSDPIGVGCGANYSYPNSTTAAAAQPRYSKVVNNSLATFISLHFRDFNLPPGDFVRVHASNPNDEVTTVLEYHGNHGNGSDFYSDSLATTSVVVELFTNVTDAAVPVNSSSCLGFTIDGYNYLAQTESAKETVCGIDESQEAACFADAINASTTNAVVRLLTHLSKGSFYCTGWLVGSEGHLITNNHCIATQADASATEYEFKAQGADCDTLCNTQLGCPGTKPEGLSVKFIATSVELDYTLVKLDARFAATYGYLKLRASGAKLNEEIFLIGHPEGWGKRIAQKANGTLAKVEALNGVGCSTTAQVSYSLDTRPGSSGSPVLSSGDGSVIALHHCGGCPNMAINANKIVKDMNERGILPANSFLGSLAESGLAVETVSPTPAATTPAPTPAPTTPAPTPAQTTLTLSPASTLAPTPAPTPAPTTLTPSTPAATTTTVVSVTPSPTPASTPVTTSMATKTVVDGTIFSTATASSVDYIDFNVSADALVELDVLSMEALTQGNVTSFTDVNGDCNAGYLDSHILLFRLNSVTGGVSASDLVEGNDNASVGAGTGDGSVSVADSFLSVFLTKGAYRLAVGPSPMTTEQAVAKLTSVSTRVKVCDGKISNYGSYRVTLSSSAAVAAKSPNTYIGNQCSASNTVRPYTSCQYHTEADTSRSASVDGTIVRSTASVSVDYIPFSVTSFGRVTIEVVSYESRNGSDYIDVNGFCESAYIDPVAFLFRANAAGLTAADLVNAGDDDDSFAWRTNRRSVSFRDPYLSLGLPSGKYVLVVGRYPLSLQDAIARVGSQSIDLHTPASCGQATAKGNYRALLRAAQALATTSPDSFSGQLCPTNQGHALCTA